MPASTSYGNNIEFEGVRHTRVAAFDLLARIDEPERRKTLFMAFVPLWRAINADGGSGSPYRRLIGMAAAEARQHGSEIDAAARTMGVSSASVEDWLTRILDAWRVGERRRRRSSPGTIATSGGGAERALGDVVPRETLQRLSARYYADLGADLASMGTLYDLEPRPGKAPLAYADFVSRGRIRGRHLATHRDPRLRQLFAWRTRRAERARARGRPRRPHDGRAYASGVHGSRRLAVRRGLCRRPVMEHLRSGLAAQVPRAQRARKPCRCDPCTRR